MKRVAEVVRNLQGNSFNRNMDTVQISDLPQSDLDISEIKQ